MFNGYKLYYTKFSFLLIKNFYKFLHVLPPCAVNKADVESLVKLPIFCCHLNFIQSTKTKDQDCSNL